MVDVVVAFAVAFAVVCAKTCPYLFGSYFVEVREIPEMKKENGYTELSQPGDHANATERQTSDWGREDRNTLSSVLFGPFNSLCVARTKRKRE